MFDRDKQRIRKNSVCEVNAKNCDKNVSLSKNTVGRMRQEGRYKIEESNRHVIKLLAYLPKESVFLERSFFIHWKVLSKEVTGSIFYFFKFTLVTCKEYLRGE